MAAPINAIGAAGLEVSSTETKRHPLSLKFCAARLQLKQRLVVVVLAFKRDCSSIRAGLRGHL